MAHVCLGSSETSHDIIWWKILEISNFEWAILTRGSSDKAMALYQYFQPSDSHPDPIWLLSESVGLAAIKGTNNAVALGCGP